MKALTIILVFLGSFSSSAEAQWTETSTQLIAAAEQLPQVRGVVRRIDLVNSKITLKHEEIPNLQMPGMTMPFSVPLPEMLNGLNLGDKVFFTADEVNGELTVMSIEKRP